MSDTALYKFVQYGTAAERAAFTPSPPAGVNTLYVFRETDTGDTYEYDTSWHLVASSGSTAGSELALHRLAGGI